MNRIFSRMLTRLAIVVASLAWAGFVFTQTVGDPGRGERIAAAVLDDDAARAEVVAPIATRVMSTTGLPAEQRPFVEQQVDLLLQDPATARIFIEPFAGSWSRMLGEDDPRPAALDASALVDRITTSIGAVPPAAALPVTDVPLPRAELGWMGDVRRSVNAAVLPLALLAGALFVVAFMTGERPRVLRRFGAWAIGAGLLWVIVPPGLVWAAQRWAPGADAVVAAALDEAMSGLLGAALALVVAGFAAIGGSFMVGTADARAPTEVREPWREAGGYASGPARPAAARTVNRVRQHTSTRPATSGAATRTMPAVPPASAGADGMTGTDVTTPLPRVQPSAPDAGKPEEDSDALWDYYSS